MQVVRINRVQVRCLARCAGRSLPASGPKDIARKNLAIDRIGTCGKDRGSDRDIPTSTSTKTSCYVDDGDIATSAGSASAIDLAIHLVRNDHGSHVANLVAHQLVVAPHRYGGQAQFVTTPATTVAPDNNLAGTLEWIIDHLEQDLSLTTMAHNANLSTRQFSRRFKETTGTTPHHWLLRQRILRARELLEQGSISIEEVARRCGFASTAAMRPHFTRFVTTSPTAYKRSFAPR